MSEESKKVRTSDLIEPLKKIEALTNELKVVVDALPECNVKTRYTYSVENLQKKNDEFLNAGQKKELTSEQKELIRRIKKGEISAEEVLKISSSGENTKSTVPKKSKGNK